MGILLRLGVAATTIEYDKSPVRSCDHLVESRQVSKSPDLMNYTFWGGSLVVVNLRGHKTAIRGLGVAMDSDLRIVLVLVSLAPGKLSSW